MDSKVMTMEQAVSLLKDGDMLAVGGNVLHRTPMVFIRQVVLSGKRGLHLVKTAGSQEVDMLCAGGNVEEVDAGFVSYETKYGLALHYRKEVESGRVKANEHACYTVISALRAAVCGSPFMPVRGLVISDLLKYNNYFDVVEDPFGSGPIAVVKALVPDVAVIHVQKCDRYGNAIIEGMKFEDVLMAKAAKKVIITTEELLNDRNYQITAERVTIPYFLVDAVVHAPRGAAPCSCYGKYEVDEASILEFKKLKKEEVFDYCKKYNAIKR